MAGHECQSVSCTVWGRSWSELTLFPRRSLTIRWHTLARTGAFSAHRVRLSPAEGPTARG